MVIRPPAKLSVLDQPSLRLLPNPLQCIVFGLKAVDRINFPAALKNADRVAFADITAGFFETDLQSRDTSFLLRRAMRARSWSI